MTETTLILFQTEKNDEINSENLPDTIEKIYLRGFNQVRVQRWPKSLFYLETYFRPDFGNLPQTLKELKIVTQNEVRKEFLPKDLEILHIEAPNSKTTTFHVKEDDYDLYRISIDGFSKYNVFTGAYDHDDLDNIKHYDVVYNYEVDGDIAF